MRSSGTNPCAVRRQGLAGTRVPRWCRPNRHCRAAARTRCRARGRPRPRGADRTAAPASRTAARPPNAAVHRANGSDAASGAGFQLGSQTASSIRAGRPARSPTRIGARPAAGMAGDHERTTSHAPATPQQAPEPHDHRQRTRTAGCQIADWPGCGRPWRSSSTPSWRPSTTSVPRKTLRMFEKMAQVG